MARPDRHINSAVVGIASVGAVVLLICAFVGYLLLGISYGQHSTINGPCDLLHSSDFTALGLGPSPAPDPTPGRYSSCTWDDLGSIKRIELMAYCIPRGFLTSAEQQPHKQYQVQVQADSSVSPTMPIQHLGDEAEIADNQDHLEVRTGNVLWTFYSTNYQPPQRQFLAVAQHINPELKSDRSL